MSGVDDYVRALVESEQRVADLTAEVERLRAERFASGPVVQESSLLGGWQVRCLGCSAGTLTGFADRDAAVARAAKHVHVYPDADGYLDEQGAWPR